jgi:hypothetical protein
MSENETLTFAAAAQEQSREQRRKRDAKKKGVRGILKMPPLFHEAERAVNGSEDFIPELHYEDID